jgi:hypothetical protein
MSRGEQNSRAGVIRTYGGFHHRQLDGPRIKSSPVIVTFRRRDGIRVRQCFGLRKDKDHNRREWGLPGVEFKKGERMSCNRVSQFHHLTTVRRGTRGIQVVKAPRWFNESGEGLGAMGEVASGVVRVSPLLGRSRKLIESNAASCNSDM